MDSRTNGDFGQQIKSDLSLIPRKAIEIIRAPAAFYRQMPKTGGFVSPFVFMVVLGTAAGIIRTILSLVGLSAGGFVSGLAAVILMPIMVAVFGFIGAAALFVIWKVMGSNESFETAYRCGAYTAAVMPITAVVGLIPYLGGIAGIVWTTYLLVEASIEVHGIQPRKAWVGFGVVCAVFALSSLSMEIAARNLGKSMEKWRKDSSVNQMENLDQMSPEEAGKAVGQFLKAFGKATEEK